MCVLRRPEHPGVGRDAERARRRCSARCCRAARPDERIVTVEETFELDVAAPRHRRHAVPPAEPRGHRRDHAAAADQGGAADAARPARGRRGARGRGLDLLIALNSGLPGMCSHPRQQRARRAGQAVHPAAAGRAQHRLGVRRADRRGVRSTSSCTASSTARRRTAGGRDRRARAERSSGRVVEASALFALRGRAAASATGRPSARSSAKFRAAGLDPCDRARRSGGVSVGPGDRRRLRARRRRARCWRLAAGCGRDRPTPPVADAAAAADAHAASLRPGCGGVPPVGLRAHRRPRRARCGGLGAGARRSRPHRRSPPAARGLAALRAARRAAHAPGLAGAAPTAPSGPMSSTISSRRVRAGHRPRRSRRRARDGRGPPSTRRRLRRSSSASTGPRGNFVAGARSSSRSGSPTRWPTASSRRCGWRARWAAPSCASVLRGLAAYLREDAAVRAEAGGPAVLGRERGPARRRGAVDRAAAARHPARRRPPPTTRRRAPCSSCVGLVVSVVAYRLMIRVGRLPEERRWFG